MCDPSQAHLSHSFFCRPDPTRSRSSRPHHQPACAGHASVVRDARTEPNSWVGQVAQPAALAFSFQHVRACVLRSFGRTSPASASARLQPAAGLVGSLRSDLTTAGGRDGVLVRCTRSPAQPSAPRNGRPPGPFVFRKIQGSTALGTAGKDKTKSGSLVVVVVVGRDPLCRVLVPTPWYPD